MMMFVLSPLRETNMALLMLHMQLPLPAAIAGPLWQLTSVLNFAQLPVDLSLCLLLANYHEKRRETRQKRWKTQKWMECVAEKKRKMAQSCASLTKVPANMTKWLSGNSMSSGQPSKQQQSARKTCMYVCVYTYKCGLSQKMIILISDTGAEEHFSL